MEKIKFIKTRNVKDPERGYGDAGVDFFVPEDSPEFVKDLLMKNATKNILLKEILIQKEDKTIVPQKRLFVPPMTDVLIPSGIRSLIDPEYVLVFTNKSGVATKQRLDVGATTVDASYEGEIHLHVINTAEVPTYIDFGQKLIQGLVLKHYADKFEVVDAIEDTEAKLKEFYKDSEFDRKEGGFGSTGTK